VWPNEHATTPSLPMMPFRLDIGHARYQLLTVAPCMPADLRRPASRALPSDLAVWRARNGLVPDDMREHDATWTETLTRRFRSGSRR
jgi:hypothetical protein